MKWNSSELRFGGRMTPLAGYTIVGFCDGSAAPPNLPGALLSAPGPMTVVVGFENDESGPLSTTASGPASSAPVPPLPALPPDPGGVALVPVAEHATAAAQATVNINSRDSGLANALRMLMLPRIIRADGHRGSSAVPAHTR